MFFKVFGPLVDPFPAELTAYQLVPKLKCCFPALLSVTGSNEVTLCIIQQRQVRATWNTSSRKFNRSPDIDQWVSIDNQVMKIVV